ncbi:MAG: hypothetical protein ACI9JY_002167, partial [Saprospiraceae bacterium]
MTERSEVRTLRCQKSEKKTSVLRLVQKEDEIISFVISDNEMVRLLTAQILWFQKWRRVNRFS